MPLKGQSSSIRPTEAFTALPNKELPRGSSPNSRYFQSTEDKSFWIGRCSPLAVVNPHEQEGHRYPGEWRVYLGMVFYRHFGILTSEIVLSPQPVSESAHQRNNLSPTVSLHVMRRYVDGHSFLGKGFSQHYTRQCLKKKEYRVLGEQQKSLPLRGVGAVLAVAAFIADGDVVGRSGRHLGYVLAKDNQGEYAKLVKSDPGYAFRFIEDSSQRGQMCFSLPSLNLGFGQLSRLHRREFVDMVKQILATPRATLEALFAPSLKGKYTGFTRQQVHFFVDCLMLRKGVFLSAFPHELDKRLKQEITQVESQRHRALFNMGRRLSYTSQSTQQLREDSLRLVTSSVPLKTVVKHFQIPSLYPFMGRRVPLLTLRQGFNGKGIVCQVCTGFRWCRENSLGTPVRGPCFTASPLVEENRLPASTVV